MPAGSVRALRILFVTRGSSGHFLPLTPFADACRRAGHEVLVAAQAAHRATVERAGFAVAPVGDPPAEEWVPLMARASSLTIDEANAAMVGEFFAGIDTRAALPELRATVERWRPDVIVRESWEFAAPLVAELYGVPIARVALGLAALEDLSTQHAAAAVDEARAALGLSPDPAGERLREMPYLTMMPAALEDPAAPLPPRTLRVAATAAPAPAPLPDWWPGNDDPLVYVTFGSVAAGPHLPYYPALYEAAIAAIAPLPARLLVTIGTDRDPAELGAVPPNVHVERWVAQDDVAPHAAAIVSHGGYGTTIGALRHGVPLVVLPLFSADQWANAAAVARAGAGSRSTPSATRAAASPCPVRPRSRHSAMASGRCSASRPTAPPRATSRVRRARCPASTRRSASFTSSRPNGWGLLDACPSPSEAGRGAPRLRRRGFAPAPFPICSASVARRPVESVLRVVIADDHTMVRSGLRMLLDMEADLEVVAEAGDVAATTACLHEHAPDVLILDVHLGPENGLEAMAALLDASPTTRVLVLTMQDDPAFARKALRSGASGYVLKEAPRADLVAAVRAVARGETYLHPQLAARIVLELEPPGRLTARELEMLRLIALGHTNAQIAQGLYISVRTVETHRANLQRKLGVSGRAELVRCALERELIGP